MTAAPILSRIREAGGDAVLDNGRLRIIGASRIAPGLLAEARSRRDDLLAELESPPFIAPADDIERSAIQAEASMPAPPEPPPLAIDDPLVTRLAAALMAPRPWQRITDPEKALAYFQAEALRRLQRLSPLARGLLVISEESEAARWKP
jgi:hypothetical protein